MARVPAEARRKELVDAAIRVMTRDGVEKATTRAIAAEAGMQLGFFHYCFRSKEELLESVLTTIDEHNLHAAIQHLTPRADVRDMLRASVRAYWRHVEQNPGEHQLTYELTQYALRRPALAGLARKQYQRYLTTTADFLNAAAEAGGVEWTVPVPALARYQSAVLDGATLAWIVDGDSETALAVLDHLAEHLAASCRPATASRSAAKLVENS